MKIHDVSLLLHGEMVIWPGDPKLSMNLASSIAKGGVANVTRIEMGAHTGTHMDAPFHFEPNGTGIDKVSLETLIGPCRVFDLSGGAGHITRADIEAGDMTGVTRALFKTRNSKRWANDEREFDRNFAAVTAEAAEYLVARKVKLVGVDYLSVEAFGGGGGKFPVHHTLLRAGMVVVEGLDLSVVPAGDYELIALPLKLNDADGAPARVVLRSEDGRQ